ncbi:MAG TPA: bifunctional riboflavin kinase/FAD synthetase [Candidatus Acidoferrales bacterium]|jgi:riboflavin kinase/FMN adenylyltransferase|nr:bifunctional riboflavin kinase/FAD synthetase [Candidatus Acidoferrales bacterium]
MALLVCNTIEDWASCFGDATGAAVSVGTFDGLHIGHQKILQSVRERARASGQRAAAITFDPHPMRVLRPDRAPLMIQTLSQRLAGFEQIGLDAALVLQFDRALSLVSPQEFIERILVGGLRVGAILVGANFRFGHRGAGDVRLLSEQGTCDGFDVEIIPPVEIGGQIVSSTAIRALVASGDVAGAIPLLARAFSLTGEIRAGQGRGRTILFPTLNLAPEQELLPKLGVYATESAVGGKRYASVTNVGTRPTFNGTGVTVESHLFGFNENVTGGPMEVHFHARIRDEQKFSGADALRAQIARDIEAARKFFSERIFAGQSSPRHGR